MSKVEDGGSALRSLYRTLPQRRRRQAWLTLVLMEIEVDRFAALRDLEVLANSLLAMERSLFGD